MRKLLMVGGALLAAALMFSADGAFAAKGAGGGGAAGGGGGGQRQTFIVFGFATIDAANAALAANPGLVGVTPAPNSALLPVHVNIISPLPRP
jgi:hypothetical protein